MGTGEVECRDKGRLHSLEKSKGEAAARLSGGEVVVLLDQSRHLFQ